MNHLPKLLLASVFLLPSSFAAADDSQPSDSAGIGSVSDKAQPSFDWSHWRGPEYNGTSRETGLINSWNPDGGPGGNVLWKRDNLGGRSTPIVLNSRLYTMVGTEFGEKVICVDAASGKSLWENSFNVWLSDVPKERVGWSSVVGDPQTGNVYALGVCGYFQCLDGKSGKTLWSVSMHEQFGLLSTYGGRTNFPFICDDLVIVSAVVIGWGEMAKPAHRFLAFDKETGEVVWFQGTRLLPYDTTYSSPTLTVLNHEKAMVFGSGDGALWAFQPRTGVPIWKFRFSRRGLNVSPLVVGDRVYSGHSEENIYGSTMGSVVALDAIGRDDITDSNELWSRPELMAGKSSPCLIDDRLYCFDDGGKLHVLDAETGESIGRKYYLRGSMRTSPLYADGKIYAFSSTGNWHILQPDKRRGVKVVKKGRLNAGEEVHASPICS
ncbi:MAG: PQQ-binding-like beta-propeller repeat protein, partial [Gammaproteobacteria bacterium]